jgi:DNA-binding transcriptional LysR family regulator
MNPEDLRSHDCVVYTGTTTSNLWAFTAGAGASDSTGSSKSVRVEGRLQTNSSEVIRSAVLTGMGIGYAPTWLFEEELASGEVVRLMPDWESSGSPIQIVSPPERRHSAKVRTFVEHISAKLA